MQDYKLYLADYITTDNTDVHAHFSLPPRTFLLVFRTRLPRRFRQDFAFTDKHHMFSRELLLQLTYQSCLNLLECL